MSVAERRIQLALDRVSHWTDSHGFRFLLPRLLPCTSAAVEASTSIRTYTYVVIGYDVLRRHAFWVPHLRSLKIIYLRALKLLRVLGHTPWGADQATLLRLYHSLVRMKLNYGMGVRYISLPHLPVSRVFDVVQHAGVRLATGALRSSPIPSLKILKFW